MIPPGGYFRNLRGYIMDIAIVFANCLAWTGSKHRIVDGGESIGPVCLRLTIALAAYAALLVGLSFAAGN